MLPELFVATVVGLSGYAAYLDLRTTEVPDRISFAIIGVSLLFYGYNAVMAGSVEPLIASLGSGIGLFLFGWTLYILGMWGGADAFVLGALGFAFPHVPDGVTPLYTAPWPTPFSFVMAAFLVGGMYSMGYATVRAARTEGFMEEFQRTVREERGRMLLVGAVLVLLFAATAALGIRAGASAGALVPPIAGSLLVGGVLLVLMPFLRTVERTSMSREIPASEVAAGDVLADELDLEAPGRTADDPVTTVTDRALSLIGAILPIDSPVLSERYGTRIVGLTEEQAAEVRARGGRVTVKRGVPFIVAFPGAALLITTVGDPFYAVLALLAG